MTSRLALALCLSFAAACADSADSAPTTGTHGAGKADSLGQPPADAPLHCWDLTFAYNMMTVTPNGDSIDFLLQGANVEIAEYAPNDGGWHPAEVRFSLPADACIRSSEDPRRFACSGNDVAAKVAVDFEAPVDATLSYLDIATTHAVRTDAADQVTESLELSVITTTANDRGSYRINFPLELDACE